MATQEFNIAVMPGDGIGAEVMPEALKVLDYVEQAFDIHLNLTHHDWGHCDYYLEHGDMMPADWKDILGTQDAILFGAVGWPEKVPDNVSLWGSILRMRREFDQYINLRPVKSFKGVASNLATADADQIDFLIVRENTEGEYSSIGGIMFEGTDRETVMQQSMFTRHGADRVLRYAYELASQRENKKLTVATKSNGMAISMPWWDSRAEAIGEEYSLVKMNRQHIDILCARFVMHPSQFDVVVATNLFGDILSDLGPACTGTIGLAASANMNPDKVFPSLFEPVHGSAPDIAGKGIANPIAMIWSAALMLDFLGDAEGPCHAAHNAMMKAIEFTLEHGPHTIDMKGNASTSEMGDAVLQNLKREVEA